MTDWLQFSLLDMTPYDRQGWFWLIESYQQDYPYLSLASLLYSVLLAYVIFRPVPHAPRLAIGLLALGWFWCGSVFQMQYHANLNWAAPHFGWVFIVQAGLLALIATFNKTLSWRNPGSRAHCLVLVVLLLALFYPMVGFFEGRTAQQLEWPGLMAAPTTLATLGVLMLLEKRYWVLLMPVPVLWALVSAAFTWKLELLEPYVIAASLLVLAVVLFFARNKVPNRHGSQRGTDA